MSDPGQQRGPSEDLRDDESSVTRRAAESYLRSADANSPLAILAARDELRDRTVSALQRVLEASMQHAEGETRTQKLLRRYDAARQELSAANFELAAAWKVGKRAPDVLRAVSKLRRTVQTAQERAEARPDGLLATKQYELTRYARELATTRFAVTPSRDTALEELLEAVVQGRPVLMLGPSGTGKTTLVKELARRLTSELEIIPGNEVTAGQLWGTRGLDPEKGDVIRDGIVARAMIGGKGLLWDEANASDEAMEKFLKFKAYLTMRAGDPVRVPPEHPELRPIDSGFFFVLSGNPKSQKHTNRAEFPPEVARELGEVPLGYLPEEEMFDLALAGLVEGDTLPLGIEEVRQDGVLHNLVKFIHEVQNLYLGESAARGAAGTPTLRKLVIDPGMVTAWLTGWSFARATRGDSLATYLDRQLVGLANSEKYSAEDRALLVQTAARFHFLTTAQAKAALRVPGLAPTALNAFTPFTPELYAPERDTAIPLTEAVKQHPYVAARLTTQFTAALNAVAQKAGKTAAEVQSLLIGSSLPERLQELQSLAKGSADDLAALFPATTKPAGTTTGTPPAPPPPAPTTPATMPDLLRPTWGVDEMKAWLQATLATDGETLESKLEGKSFDKQVRKYVRSFADGPYGFALDLSRVRFPHDALTLARLKEGIEAGAITGIVIEAYPTLQEVQASVQGLAAAGGTAPTEAELIDGSVVDFWAKHFQARGGKMWDIANRLAQWRKMKWSRNPAEPLWKLFADQNGHTISDYVDKNGARTQEYKDDHAAVYAALPDQPKLGEMLGTVSVVFANTKKDVPKTSKILGARGVTALPHGDGLSFIKLLSEQVDTITPAEYLALATAMSTPGDTSTYPDPNTWTYFAGIDPTYAARAYSDSDGLCLGWDGPGYSISYGRVRSVVR